MINLKPWFPKNDRLAHIVIMSLSLVTCVLVLIGSRIKIGIDLNFNVHNLAVLNALLNAVVSVLLILGLFLVKLKRYALHRNVMLLAVFLSVLFLLSYVAHHFLSDSTRFGGSGMTKYVYYFILITHILLAILILPFSLYTSYRALTGDYVKHKKLSRAAFPVWLYVSVTGVIVYLMISPYYN